MANPASLVISSTTETVETLIKRTAIPPSMHNALNSSDILLIPRDKYGDHQITYFPNGTEELFNYLRSVVTVKTDICILDEDFKELTLHADELILSDIVVQLIAAPILAGLLIEFLKAKLMSRWSKTDLRSRIIVEDKIGDRSVKLDFNGPVSEFKELMDILKEVNTSESLNILADSADLNYAERLKRLRKDRKQKTDENE